MKMVSKTIIIGALTIFTWLMTTATVSLQVNAASDEKLLPPEPVFIWTDPKAIPSTGTPHLPDESLRDVLIPSLIKILLGIAGSLTLVGLTVGGFILVTAQGEEDAINRGKRIIQWTVIALILMSVSYAIIYGVASLDFTPLEEPPTGNTSETE